MALGCQPPHPLFKEKTMAKQWKPVLLALAMTAVAAPVLAADCAVEIEGNDAMQFNKPTISVPASCKQFTVKLKHVGKLPKTRSEEHTSELQSQSNLVCRLLLEKKKKK